MATARRARAVPEADEGALLALTPPYAAMLPLSSLRGMGALPLGAVVVGLSNNPSETLASLASLTLLTYSSPWVVPCLVHPQAHFQTEALVQLVRELRDRLVIATIVENRRSHDALTSVIRAVRTRPCPTPTTMALWVSQRLRQARIEEALRRQFELARGARPGAGHLSPASYSRLFRRCGVYTARDWRAIARVAWYAHALATPGEAGDAVHVRTRTLVRHAPKYLRVSHHVIGKRLGWEWVLEASLRTGGYVSDLQT